MQFNKRFSPFNLILLGILVLFVSHMYSAFILRPLWNDGASWLFSLINERTFFWDKVYERYVVFLPQVLPYVLMHLFPDRTSLAPEIYSYTFYYGLLPYAILAITTFYLRKKNQLSLMLFPLLHFVLIHCSAQSFYVNVATDGSIVMWFAVMVFLFENNWKILVYSTPALYFIWCGYELAPVYYGSLVLLLCYRLLVKKDISRKAFWYCSIFVSSICLIYTYKFIYLKGLSSSAHVNHHFVSGLLSMPMGLGLFSCLTLILMFFGFTKSQNKKITLWIVLLLIFIFCLFQSYSYSPYELFFVPYHARTTVYPRTFFLLILFVLYDYYKPEDITFYLVLILGLILANVENIRANYHWKMAMNGMERTSRENPGCVLMSQKKFHTFLGNHGVVDWALPFLSSLEQKTKMPKSILFTERRGYPVKDQALNPCTNNFNNTLLSVGDFNVTIPVGFPNGFKYPFLSKSFDFQIFEWPGQTIEGERAIWEESTIESDLYSFKKGIKYLLVLKLRGSSFKGELAKVKIGLPDGEFKELEVTTEFKNYQFHFTLGKDLKKGVLISFLNDNLDTKTGEDQNLYFGGAYLTPFKLDEPLLLK